MRLLLNKILPGLAAVVAVLSFPADGLGQATGPRTTITASDSSNHSTAIVFGVDPAATDCIDPSLGEFELPPGGCTGSGLCIAFKDLHNDSTACLGEGLLLNLRQYLSSSQVDTYRIVYNFQDYPVLFRWAGSITSYDSAKIVDELGGALFNIDMLTSDSMVMQSPLVSTVLIVAWGPKINPVSVGDSPGLPLTTSLGQNYPNPFNPVTTIRYSVGRPADGHTGRSGGQAGLYDGQAGAQFVSLAIYDMMGREVASLVRETKSPGEYTARWDAAAMPSGIYYFRLRAGAATESRKMLLVK